MLGGGDPGHTTRGTGIDGSDRLELVGADISEEGERTANTRAHTHVRERGRRKREGKGKERSRYILLIHAVQ